MHLSWEYLAGLFDGEGYVGLTARPNNSMAPAPDLSIANTCEELIDMLVAQVGGSKRIAKPSKEHHKVCCYWTLWNKAEIQVFVEGILPFSVVKRTQLLLLQEALTLMPGSGAGERTEEELLPIYLIMNRLTALRARPKPTLELTDEQRNALPRNRINDTLSALQQDSSLISLGGNSMYPSSKPPKGV